MVNGTQTSIPGNALKLSVNRSLVDGRWRRPSIVVASLNYTVVISASLYAAGAGRTDRKIYFEIARESRNSEYAAPIDDPRSRASCGQSVGKNFAQRMLWSDIAKNK